MMRFRLRDRRAAAVVAMAASAAFALAGVVAAPSSQAALGYCSGQPRVVTARPGADLVGVISSLCAGDTLALAPGTYATGYLRFFGGALGRGGIRSGTPTAPITITSADPGHPAWLQGGLQFYNANYWHLSHLKVQAVGAGAVALLMYNGVAWSVTSSEFFGARQTNTMANVLIAGAGGYPTRFVFSGNLVHDAAVSTPGADQNLYITFHGAPGSGGLVTRNVIWNAPRGENIKLGDGGAYNSPGPWGVTVTFNTLFGGGRQILLHGNVRNNVIAGNLLVRATQRFVADPRTTEIYIHDMTGAGNVFHHNYAFAATMLAYDPRHAATYLTGNRMYNDAAHDPRIATNAGRPLFASNPLAAPYGAYGTGR
jgi:hypothetical protein